MKRFIFILIGALAGLLLLGSCSEQPQEKPIQKVAKPVKRPPQPLQRQEPQTAQQHRYLLPPDKVRAALPTRGSEQALGRYETLDSVLLSGRYFQAVADGGFLYCASLRGVDWFTLTGESPLTLAGSCPTPGQAVEVLLAGDFALVADDYAGIAVLARTDDGGFTYRNQTPTSAMVKSLALVGTEHVAACHHSDGIVLYRLNKDGRLSELSKLETNGRAFRLAVVGDRAALANGPGPLMILNVSVPERPAIAAQWGGGTFIIDCCWKDGRLLAADRKLGLIVLDQDNAGNIVKLAEYPVGGKMRRVVSGPGNLVFLVTDTHVHLIDVTNPLQPNEVGSLLPKNEFRDAFVTGGRLIVMDGDQGPAMWDITNPTHPRELARHAQFRLISDVVWDGNAAYVAAGADGFYVYQVASTGQLSQLAHLSNGLGLVTSVALMDGTVFLADRQGIRALDVSNPAAPIVIGSLQLPGQTVALDCDPARHILYVADWFAGVQIIDVSDPKIPKRLGTQDTEGWVVEVIANGAHCYACAIDCGLVAVDARNPCQPTITSVNREIESPEGGAVRDGVLYLADFNNGLVLLDVSDPGNPSVLTSVPTGTAKGIVLDQHRLWLANYFWGIKVFSLEQPLNPALVASLDTPGKAYEIAVDGNRALIADWHSLISGQLVLPERDVNPVLHP